MHENHSQKHDKIEEFALMRRMYILESICKIHSFLLRRESFIWSSSFISSLYDLTNERNHLTFPVTDIFLFHSFQSSYTRQNLWSVPQYWVQGIVFRFASTISLKTYRVVKKTLKKPWDTIYFDIYDKAPQPTIISINLLTTTLNIDGDIPRFFVTSLSFVMGLVPRYLMLPVTTGDLSLCLFPVV